MTDSPGSPTTPIAVDKLSPRQRECLHLYWTDQATSKEIAAVLGVSRYTVDGYFKEAIETLGARDRRDAARLAFGPPPAHPPTASAATPPLPPAASGPPAAGVPRRPDWRSLLPLRTGAHNDLNVAARLVWIFLLAVLAAVGFGAVANAVYAIDRLFRSAFG